MSSSAPQTERGHERPFVFQFNVFLPNRVGQLSEILAFLADQEIEIAGLSVVDATDWAVVRMIFTDPDKARELLTRRHIAFTETEVLAMILEEPGTLRKACDALLGAELNVQFAYPMLIRRETKPVIVLRVDDHVLGAHVLTKHGFTVLDHEDV